MYMQIVAQINSYWFKYRTMNTMWQFVREVLVERKCYSAVVEIFRSVVSINDSRSLYRCKSVLFCVDTSVTIQFNVSSEYITSLCTTWSVRVTSYRYRVSLSVKHTLTFLNYYYYYYEYIRTISSNAIETLSFSQSPNRVNFRQLLIRYLLGTGRPYH